MNGTNIKSGCFREVIAASCVAEIERCSCGNLHLVIGPFTLRLSPEQFRMLVDTMLDGHSHLHAQSEAQRSPEALARLLGRHTPTGQS